MAAIRQSDDESSGLYDESLLLEFERSAENADSGDDADDQRLNSSCFSSASFSHWSHSWSKHTEIRSESENYQFTLLSDDSTTEEPAQETGILGIELLPRSDNCSRALMGAGNEECFCLLCALRDLIMGSLASNTTVSSWNLVNNLTYISSNFQRYQQEDAHEFLQCFLDKLEGCHDSESKICVPLQNDNIVQQVFGGRLVSNLKCCNCGHCSDTYEPTIDLSLEIDDVENLFMALHSFTKVEKIEDPEIKFTCEKCNERVFVEKKLSFDQVPTIAVLHLKRFKNDGSFVQKIDKHVAFPIDLNLEPFTGSGNYNSAELRYVLYAVVVHIGFGPTSGHYYCFIRLSSDTWCKFDDSMVELVPEDYVLSQDAYVLFYAKETTPWFSSFIETHKEFVNSNTWNTSPKSVLDNIHTSVSPSLDNKFTCNANEVNYDIGSSHEGGNDNGIEYNEPVQNDIKRKESVCDPQETSKSVATFTRNSSYISTPKVQKVSPFLLEEVCAREETAFRSPSPEIYRENSPERGFTICQSHLRTRDNLPSKRRLVKNMDDEMKQAHACLQKNIHSSRRQQLLAALRGSQTEPPLNRRRLGD